MHAARPIDFTAGPWFFVRQFAPALVCLLIAAPSHAQTVDEPRFNVRAFEVEGDVPIPRERALASVLNGWFPNWRRLRIHESSPGRRGLSPKLALECPGYTATQYLPGEPPGSIVDGVRNENLGRGEGAVAE